MFKSARKPATPTIGAQARYASGERGEILWFDGSWVLVRPDSLMNPTPRLWDRESLAWVEEVTVTGEAGEIRRLQRREADLLEANNRYLERARNAERVLQIFREFWFRNVTQAMAGARTDHPMWSLIAEALSPTHSQRRSKAEYQFICSDNRRTLAEIERSPL